MSLEPPTPHDPKTVRWLDCPTTHKMCLAATEALRAPGDVLVHPRRARDLADRSYASPRNLADLAAAACLSKHHFVRMFKATYGTTPMENVSQRRIERAQDLLRATDLTVTEVCLAVGFSSLGSFSSRFRALVGERRPALPRSGP